MTPAEIQDLVQTVTSWLSMQQASICPWLNVLQLVTFVPCDPKSKHFKYSQCFRTRKELRIFQTLSFGSSDEVLCSWLSPAKNKQQVTYGRTTFFSDLLSTKERSHPATGRLLRSNVQLKWETKAQGCVACFILASPARQVFKHRRDPESTGFKSDKYIGTQSRPGQSYFWILLQMCRIEFV